MLATLLRPDDVKGTREHRRTLSYDAASRVVMPAANSVSIDVDGLSKRVPKLAVRNRVLRDASEDLANQPAGVVREDGSRPPLSPHTSERTASLSLTRQQSDQSQQSSHTVDGLKPEGQGSVLPKPPSSGDKARKKNGTGVFGFLTLKEPSTSAWEEYAKVQKAASAQKGGRTSAIRVPGVSSQKLPHFVPATNAKWDGLPDSAKRLSTRSKDSSNRMSTLSTSARHTTRSIWSSYSQGSGERSTRRTFGSISSRPSLPESAPRPQSKRGSVQSQASSIGPGRAAPEALPPSAIHPALRKTAVAPWDEPPEHYWQSSQEAGHGRSPETFLHPPSPPPVLPEPSSLLQTPELELSEVLALREHYTSPEPSPRTPPTDGGRLEQTDPVANQYQYVQLGDQHVHHHDNGTFWHSDTDNEADDVKVSKFQGMSMPVNFSRPGLVQMSHPSSERALPVDMAIAEIEEDRDVLQPTLRDERGRTSPFTFEQLAMDKHQPPNILRATPSVLPARTCSTSSRLISVTATTAMTVTAPLHSPTFSVDANSSTRPPTAAPTVSMAIALHRTSLSLIRSNSDASSRAPSEVSVQWTMSPKERLGLGGKVVRRSQGDVLPWEGDEIRLSNIAAKRQSVGQAAQDGNKLKRLSLRLSRK